jgi:hypothetical protein
VVVDKVEEEKTTELDQEWLVKLLKDNKIFAMKSWKIETLIKKAKEAGLLS